MKVVFKDGQTFTTVLGEGEYDGSYYLTRIAPAEMREHLNRGIRVEGEDFSAYYHPGAAVLEQSVNEGLYRYKIVNPTPTIERLKNIEDALVELYELLEV